MMMSHSGNNYCSCLTASRLRVVTRVDEHNYNSRTSTVLLDDTMLHELPEQFILGVIAQLNAVDVAHLVWHIGHRN